MNPQDCGALTLPTLLMQTIRDSDTATGQDQHQDQESRVQDKTKKPRGIRVNGLAEIVERGGQFGKSEYLRITPKVSWSWGIEEVKLKEEEWLTKTVH